MSKEKKLPQIKSPNYHFPDRSGPQELGTPFQKIVIAQLVSPDTDPLTVEDEYEEIARLVETLDGKVVANVVQRKSRPHPEYCVGPGKADEIGTGVTRALDLALIARFAIEERNSEEA